VFTFPNPVASADSASVTSGTGVVSSFSPGASPNEYNVNLVGVVSPQYITITLDGVRDAAGNVTAPSVPVTMGVLIGDSNADRSVNSGDALQTRNRSGQPADATNFRSDFNLDGTINSGDATVVRSRSGQSIP